MKSRRTRITLGTIKLRWSRWHTWKQIEKLAVRNRDLLPFGESGVYEARKRRRLHLLTIGKSMNLGRRIVNALVRGKLGHSAGKKIRKYEDTSRIQIRWALTDFPSAVEEMLHKRYVKRFGKWPKYTKRT